MSSHKKNMMLKIQGLTEDAAIDSIIQELWDTYDTDKNGTLDYKETR